MQNFRDYLIDNLILEGDTTAAYDMEKVIVAKSRTVSQDKTMICCTRYGNVMASRGSVIPLFIDQIKSGNPKRDRH